MPVRAIAEVLSLYRYIRLTGSGSQSVHPDPTFQKTRIQPLSGADAGHGYIGCPLAVQVTVDPVSD